MAVRDRVISLLRKERKWAAIPLASHNIQLSRRIGKRTVTVVLALVAGGKFRLLPATYRFRSTVSHFDYAEETEKRFSRNKGIFKSLLTALKESTVASYIENLDTYLKVNTANDNSDKGQLKKELKELKTR